MWITPTFRRPINLKPSLYLADVAFAHRICSVLPSLEKIYVVESALSWSENIYWVWEYQDSQWCGWRAREFREPVWWLEPKPFVGI
jgi:hypothetical protein